MNILGFILGGK